MSSIAFPRRTEVVDQLRWLAAVRLGLAAVVLSALLVTFTPFHLTFSGQRDAGDMINQIGYSALGAIVIAGHAMLTDRSALATLARPAWIAMAFWMAASCLWAASPSDSLRSVIFTLLAMIAATGAICFPKDDRDFRTALSIAALAVILLSYMGLVALPTLAIHQASGDEPAHAGLWRGIYAHKNIAGTIFGALFFCGVYLMRSRAVMRGLAVCVLSVVFLAGTGSKTALVLVPLVSVVVVLLRIACGRFATAFAIFLGLAAMAALTIGTVLSPFLHSILETVLPGTTFTGRMDLWRFALGVLPGHEWTGFGLNGFWQGPVAYSQAHNFELSWDPRNMPNGHNGFLDLVISMGWPGLVLGLLVLVVLPLADFVRVRGDARTLNLADMFLMILTFLLFNSLMESFLFARANPIWMFLWFAVVGLRMLSRHRVA